MSDRPRPAGRAPLTAFAFALALTGCAAGMVFCFVKSPQARSAAYLDMSLQAVQSHHTSVALSAAWEAARLDPSSVRAWRQLSGLLKQSGHEGAGWQADRIASSLQSGNTAAPGFHTLPAELKLSFLATTRDY